MALVVRLNEREIEVDLAVASNLSELVEEVAKEHFGDREIVSGLSVNGKAVEVDEIDETGKMAVSKINELHISSINDPAQEAIELLRHMGSYLKSFSEGAEAVAARFRSGDPGKANEVLTQAIDGIKAFIELLNSVQLLTRSDLTHLKSAGESYASKEEALLETTTKMITDQKNQDWISVADTLEYEMGPLMKDWSAIIPLIENEVAKVDN